MAGRRLSSVLSEALLQTVLEIERDPRPGMPARKRIHRIADALVKRAEMGDMVATALIFDRLEGKAVQPVDVSVDTRLTVAIGGLVLRPDSTDASHTVIDAASQQVSGDTGDAERDGSAHGVLDVARDVLDIAPPHTHDASPVTNAPDVPASDPFEDARARILAALDGQ